VTQGTSVAARTTAATLEKEGDAVTDAQALADHPVRLTVTDDLRRSRLTVFFRLLLVIPHLILAALWGVAVALAVIVAWFVALVTGRVPAGLHGFMASFLRYTTRVRAYHGILANPYPPFGSGGVYPVDAEIDPAAPQSRLTVLFRLLLAIPALVLAYVFQIGLNIVAFFGWIVSVIMGRMPQGLESFGTYCLRWETQTWAYVFLLTGRYPSLAGIG
jgi:hypothetical protein